MRSDANVETERSERRGKNIDANPRRGSAVDQTVKAGAEAYDRMRDLPKLIRFDTLVEFGDTAEQVEAIVARLERALRAERNRARSGHWTYDLNRHIALRQAHRAETERLSALRHAQR